MNPWEKIALIGASVGMAIALTPLELAMLPSHLHIYLIAFKVYMFGVAPLVILWVDKKTSKSTQEQPPDTA